jgi:hypothetical protein
VFTFPPNHRLFMLSHINKRPPLCQAMIPPGKSFLGSQGNSGKRRPFFFTLPLVTNSSPLLDHASLRFIIFLPTSSSWPISLGWVFGLSDKYCNQILPLRFTSPNPYVVSFFPYSFSSPPILIWYVYLLPHCCLPSCTSLARSTHEGS